MKRLLKKSNNEYVYKFKSPIMVNLGDEFTWRSATYQLSEDNEFADIISNAVDDEMNELGPKGLAEYLDEPEINDLVESIIVKVENDYAITTVKSIEELSGQQKEIIKNYITGQFSDGWGEGFEQQTLTEWTSSDEEGIESTETLSASFWNSKNWTIQEI